MNPNPVGPHGSERLSTRHRNLFNGDTCVFFYNPEKWQPEDFKLQRVNEAQSGILDPATVPVGGPFKASAIHRYVDELADNGIDTFLVNANACRAWYPSKVIPTILDGYVRGDREYFRGHAVCQGATEPADVERFIDRIMAFMNLYQDLLDAGVDWLAEAAKACRRRGVAPWVSVRMNDYHGHKNIDGSFFNLPLLKNPAMRLKHSGYAPTMFEPGYRTGLNYEKVEVRDLMMAQIKEVVEDYDYEGLELDWWRQPLCCEPNASQATIDMMSDWLREVRALTQRRAQATGRPYPLGLRIPGQLDTLRSIGLDVVTLCREGVIDFVAPSGFWCTSWEMPHDTLRRQLGERVTIYGVIEDGANPLPTHAPTLNHTQGIRFISSSHEMLRANAAGKLVLGAEGIEWFNFYCTDPGRIPGLISDYTALRNIDRLEWLRGQPKHYSFSMSGHGLVLPPFEVTPQLPATLEKWWNRSFRLPMCAEPADRGLELVIQIVLKAADPKAVLSVAFNGCWPRLEHVVSNALLFPCGPLTQLTPEHTGCNYRFPLELVRDGWNEITIENGNETPLTVVCIEVAIRPGSA
ncbi:MAG: hypothetical protein K9M98_02600 [Cephaloticoccus sp.]|nr:hypothetical protein [Cephaloticoccus sp.]